MRQVARGAEAVISEENGTVTKERIRKGYRIEQIDLKLREKRTKTEARLLREARRAGVPTPQILEDGRFSIKMELVDGKKIKDALNTKNFRALSEKIGAYIGLLHTYGIIHGDLTTSNMMLKGDELYFIDFGLGFFSQKDEDKATDLHLLRQAIDSTHFDVAEKAWKGVLNAYSKQYKGSDKVIKTLSKIEKRGRYAKRQKGE